MLEGLVGALVVLILLSTFLWSVLAQRKNVNTQREAMAIVQTELDLARKQIQNQERIIQLLEQIRDHQRPVQ